MSIDEEHCRHCQEWDCFSLNWQYHTNGLGAFWDDEQCPYCARGDS